MLQWAQLASCLCSPHPCPSMHAGLSSNCRHLHLLASPGLESSLPACSRLGASPQLMTHESRWINPPAPLPLGQSDRSARSRMSPQLSNRPESQLPTVETCSITYPLVDAFPSLSYFPTLLLMPSGIPSQIHHSHILILQGLFGGTQMRTSATEQSILSGRLNTYITTPSNNK